MVSCDQGLGPAGPAAGCGMGNPVRPRLPTPCCPQGSCHSRWSACLDDTPTWLPDGLPQAPGRPYSVPPLLKNPLWLPTARDRCPGTSSPKPLPGMAWCPVTWSHHLVFPGPPPPPTSLPLLQPVLCRLTTSSHVRTCSRVSSSVKAPSSHPTALCRALRSLMGWAFRVSPWHARRPLWQGGDRQPCRARSPAPVSPGCRGSGQTRE